MAQPSQPSGELESNPDVYQLNSVRGAVLADGAPIAGATITVVATGAEFPVSEAGTYLIVLDPEELGARHHELRFAAPGHEPQTHVVRIPENGQTRFDVELARAK